MIPSKNPLTLENSLHDGQTLHNGEYLIKQLLIQGETDNIYLATHTTLSTSLTLKQVPADQPLPENVRAELDYILHGGNISQRAAPAHTQEIMFPSSGGKYTDRFLREALFMARLQHPALPTLYDYFSEDGYWYLVMDAMCGQSLQHYLQCTAPLNSLEALGYAMQLCDILDYLHHQQPPVIFCMLHPDTIMLLPDKSLMLFNFSGARYFKEPRPIKQLSDDIQPVNYAAPELFIPQGTLDVRADLYSLGCILREMIMGQQAANDDDGKEQLVPISTMLNGLIKLAIREEVAERFQSAPVFYLALERAYRIEERLHYQRQLFNASLQPATRQHQEEPASVPATVGEPDPDDETEVTACVPDLEQRRLTRESLQKTRLERLEQEQLEVHFASVDESLQRRSSTTLSHLSLHTLEAPPQRPERAHLLTGNLLHRLIQVCFMLALLIFMFLSSLLIYTRILQPAQKHTEIINLPAQKLNTPLPGQPATLSNSWLRLPSLPREQADNAAVYVEEQGHTYVYMNGAYHSPKRPSYDRNLYRYDVATTQWEVVPLQSFPGMINNAAAVDEKNSIFFTAGYSSDTYTVPSLLYWYTSL
ncbi:hypothetical protein KDW_14990 [Dictyobacter vulcani]|uniref:non-specific serine/threonine protein kinase n=1 Tax=Dictyobacter vulcani TaxID=2607529 RepID=A0A5J4KLP5_9CHLR|nr:protein kinase [Dictyobacter vulcani]GER87337.1 hypothetical protein KDW_14990 [Dictyobacter vulcani]